MPEIPGGYRHLTYDDRCEIQRMLGASESVSSIARSLDRSVSSITREILRNRRDDGYRSTPAAMVRLCVHYRTCEVKSLCPLVLTDRGHEFQNHVRIERGGRTRVYYCDAGRADQKGSIENCHGLLRRIVPKGTSIDHLTRRDAAIIASHVNSMPRPALEGASPFDLARHVLPAELLEGLGLEHLTPDNVVLRPSVLAGGDHRH